MSLEFPEKSPQVQLEPQTTESFPHSKTDYGVLFAGFTIGNLIAGAILETDFNPVDAPPRAAITVALIFGAKKVSQYFRS